MTPPPPRRSSRGPPNLTYRTILAYPCVTCLSTETCNAPRIRTICHTCRYTGPCSYTNVDTTKARRFFKEAAPCCVFVVSGDWRPPAVIAWLNRCEDVCQLQ
ncbi:hypothetical protein PAXRUDRAFT_748443 [Paxillus rubicundulus Ve08.2h10]|uniref:Uncharacterized protein n=1 Tax=Paxillus rubicundulus Ve08.2h10 TaxID=930991 RepID=A0A0D0DHW4_9AGAM|nr:hypothetical protein PAXRUDRAFT_748443 [Paxillus rubicundulus Ve08.2h10]